MEWVRLMSTKFGDMDILPLQKVAWISGVGPAHEHPEYFTNVTDDEI